MVFRWKCSIFLLALFAMASGDDSSDSDDDVLKQALFLVKVLKSDYAEVLLRSGDNSLATTENPSTCPLTTKNSSDASDTPETTSVTSLETTPETTQETIPNTTTVLTTEKITSSTQPPILRISTPSPLHSLSATEEPWVNYAEELTEKQLEEPAYSDAYPSYDMRNRKRNAAQSRHFRKYRRLMPMEYFYYDSYPLNRRAFMPRRRGPFRRRNFRRNAPGDLGMNSSDLSSSAPPLTEPTQSSLPTTVSTPTTMYTTSPPPPMMSTTSAILSIVSSKPLSVKSESKASGRNRPKLSLRVRRTTPKYKTENVSENVVFTQVARELMNELNGGGITMQPATVRHRRKVRFRPARNLLNTRSNSGITGVQQQADVIKGFNAFRRRGTLRVHMDRSTPLAFPLSENNPYCFMNPKSKLCGTHI